MQLAVHNFSRLLEGIADLEKQSAALQAEKTAVLERFKREDEELKARLSEKQTVLKKIDEWVLKHRAPFATNMIAVFDETGKFRAHGEAGSLVARCQSDIVVILDAEIARLRLVEPKKEPVKDDRPRCRCGGGLVTREMDCRGPPPGDEPYLRVITECNKCKKVIEQHDY